jgi:hypothetical protein
MIGEPFRQTVNVLVDRYAAISQVEAVALGGSRSTEIDDTESDIDLYIYTSSKIPVSERRRIAQENAERFEVDNRNWEPGDEWIDNTSGLHIDVMFRDLDWIRQQLQNLLVQYRANIGYSTCLWFNVLHSEILYDRNGGFTALQNWADQDYPPALQQAIIAKNHPL